MNHSCNYRNKGEINPEALKSVSIFVLAGPQEKFTEAEFQYLKDYVTNGGNLFLMLGEGGETDYFNTNVNFLLEEYGMSINNGDILSFSIFDASFNLFSY